MDYETEKKNNARPKCWAVKKLRKKINLSKRLERGIKRHVENEMIELTKLDPSGYSSNTIPSSKEESSNFSSDSSVIKLFNKVIKQSESEQEVDVRKIRREKS